MTTTSIQQNILYGLGEGNSVSDTTALAYALRWANAAYRDLLIRHPWKSLNTRTIFRTSNGQATYQAPSDFRGMLVMKDEENDTIINQVTVEQFARDESATKTTDESFTSDHDVAVSLTNRAIVQYSETVTDSTGATTYVRGTDYTMVYKSGTITVLSTGSMADATSFLIDYNYYDRGKPSQFSIEYDATNAKYVFRLDPVPDAEYIMSMVYPALPNNLSGSVDAIWSQFEYVLERGGIYYGSLEWAADTNRRNEYLRLYETAFMNLRNMDQDLLPKRQQIPTVMKKTDYEI